MPRDLSVCHNLPLWHHDPLFTAVIRQFVLDHGLHAPFAISQPISIDRGMSLSRYAVGAAID